jgi:hypothetical protein
VNNPIVNNTPAFQNMLPDSISSQNTIQLPDTFWGTVYFIFIYIFDQADKNPAAAMFLFIIGLILIIFIGRSVRNASNTKNISIEIEKEYKTENNELMSRYKELNDQYNREIERLNKKIEALIAENKTLKWEI